MENANDNDNDDNGCYDITGLVRYLMHDRVTFCHKFKGDLRLTQTRLSHTVAQVAGLQ
jgi:hypothetical protein